MKFRPILTFTLLALVLSACSLAEDITPPPNYQSPISPTIESSAPTSTPEPAAVIGATPLPETTPGAAAAPVSGSETPTAIAGTISGKVSNGSGGSVPVDLKVVLHIFEHDAANSQFNEVSTQESAVSADGIYSFANVSMPASQVFRVSVDYADTTYESEAIVSKVGQSAYDLPIILYDTTTDASALVADQAHILLDYTKPDVIQVIEFYIISNPGVKTVIAAQKGESIVKVSLPKGYANLQFQDGQLGGRYLQTSNGFGDTASVAPGKEQYQLVFAFDLPYSANFEFTQPFPLNASAVSFLVSEGVKAEGQNLTDGGVKDMGNGGVKYQLYTAGSIKTGESLKVTVSGKPGQTTSAAPADGNNSTQNIIIGVGAFGLALVLAGAWLFWRDRKRITSEDDEILDDQGLEEAENTDEILDAIIALDDQHNAGNIADEAYKQRRAELKEKLKGKI